VSWILLAGVVVALAVALLAVVARRHELRRMAESVRDRERAVRQGSDEARLQHPVVDLSRCLGCATCVAVCPEDGVLELVHGQAMVVRGARCQGISACERECPTGAIRVTLSDAAERDDVPALTDELEAVGAPGLFLAGEVTAHALIKTAVEHGVAVGAEVARRVRAEAADDDGVLDLCIVGAGPAGLACSLEAKRHGLRFVTLDQERVPGGTVAKYPRRKLVLTQPVEMPLYGRLDRTSYEKEELVDLWHDIAAREALPIRCGQAFEQVERDERGGFVVRTRTDVFRARYVCLALGRRGMPNKLGVAGEELAKVAYGLMDAHSYEGRRILVVGGGDSAVEAALGLAERPGNAVTLSYRREGFFRIRSENERRLEASVGAGRLQVLYRSQVLSIQPDAVALRIDRGGRPESLILPNDEVFVLAGGVPPVDLLHGMRQLDSFYNAPLLWPAEERMERIDPALRPAPEPLEEQGSGLVRALAIGLAAAVVALAWALWHLDYYGLPADQRPASGKHALLRPGLGFGLWMGIAASVAIALNLAYLVRRSPRFALRLGSLKLWMTSHVATGLLAFLFALLHGAMAPGNTVGGHAFWALAVLLVTGAVGRYLYAYVPRAANGRELELAEVKARLGRVSEEWDQGQRRFGERARRAVDELVRARQWESSFVGRLAALVGGERALRRLLADLEREGRAEGLAPDQLDETRRLARRAHRTALAAAHYEDLRAVLATWRYLHRWVAALLVLLVAVHVLYALAYGSFFTLGGGR